MQLVNELAHIHSLLMNKLIPGTCRCPRSSGSCPQIVSAPWIPLLKKKHNTSWSVREEHSIPTSISKARSCPVHPNNRALQNRAWNKMSSLPWGRIPLHFTFLRIQSTSPYKTLSFILLLHESPLHSHLLLENGFVCSIGPGDWIIFCVRPKTGKWFLLTVFKLCTSLLLWSNKL